MVDKALKRNLRGYSYTPQKHSPVLQPLRKKSFRTSGRSRVQIPPAAFFRWFLMDCLFFIDSQNRKQFFDSILQNSGYSSWRKFTGSLNVGSHDLWEYRGGKYCLSENLFLKLLNFLSAAEGGFWSSKISRKSTNWGGQ